MSPPYDFLSFRPSTLDTLAPLDALDTLAPLDALDTLAHLDTLDTLAHLDTSIISSTFYFSLHYNNCPKLSILTA